MKRGGRLKSRSPRRDPLADAAYRATVEDIRRRANNRCENPFCPGRCGAIEIHHIQKRVNFGRTTRHLRDHPDNLIALGKSCHAWTDDPFDGPRGRLEIQGLTGERYRLGVMKGVRVNGVVNDPRATHAATFVRSTMGYYPHGPTGPSEGRDAGQKRSPTKTDGDVPSQPEAHDRPVPGRPDERPVARLRRHARERVAAAQAADHPEEETLEALPETPASPDGPVSAYAEFTDAEIILLASIGAMFGEHERTPTTQRFIMEVVYAMQVRNLDPGRYTEALSRRARKALLAAHEREIGMF